MENYQGDLADVVRASGGAMCGSEGGGGGGGGGGLSGGVPVPGWQFLADPMNYSSGMEEQADDFGDPFSNLRDPLLHELDLPSSGFFSSSNNSTELVESNVEEATGFGGGDVLAQKVLDEEMKRPCNIFSTMLQISPDDSPVLAAKSPRGIKASPLVQNDMIVGNTSKSCLVQGTGVQISSPRNTGIKRRKSQAKKVVCIQAPTPANSRPSTGEVVPSDLWAWRKYGQKPIKGSPYPRGYYRCSSSKGCSARKQVERSRTDPNMLVITYTSEHNHPWPTQRNALAGSTRSQPSKNSSASKNSPGTRAQKGTVSKEEDEEEHKEINGDNLSLSIIAGVSSCPPVKEELEDLDRQMHMDEGEFGCGFPKSYRPALPEFNQPEDFFAELGEIETDPLNLLFTHGFTGNQERESSKGLDPFSGFFDWAGNNSGSSSNKNTSFGEANKRGL
ncbi:WRKY Transcription Factor [Sarracenia purpurea var. burkii]